MISVVTTVYNELELLEGLLVQLKRLSGQAQVIIVDGSSTDGTYEVLREVADAGEGWFTLLRSPRCRGAALNVGARHAQGDALLFLHADCTLPEYAIEKVEDALVQGPVGCFAIRFEAHGPFMRWNEVASNARARLAGIMFGDQGIFVERGLFWEVGGFPEIPLMEDYEFSLRLKRSGIRPVVAEGRIVASPRRYTDAGRTQLGTAIHMLRLRMRYRLGHDVDDLARRY